MGVHLWVLHNSSIFTTLLLCLLKTFSDHFISLLYDVCSVSYSRILSSFLVNCSKIQMGLSSVLIPVNPSILLLIRVFRVLETVLNWSPLSPLLPHVPHIANKSTTCHLHNISINIHHNYRNANISYHC